MTHVIRRAAAALVLAAAVVVVSASASSAASESIGACAIEAAIEAEEHLVEQGHTLHDLHDEGLKKEFLDLEKEMEGCLEAPSPIIPEVDEIIWGGLAFVLLFGFMVWKGFPAVKGAMDARSEKIAADLDAAEKAHSDAAAIKSDHEAALAGAKAEANQIISDARSQAEQLKTELAARANEEIAELRSRAAADLESARAQAIGDLRGEVAEIAVGAAERVIRGSLDRGAQQALIDSYIDEVVRG